MKLLTAITVFSSLVNQAASECPVDLDNSVDIPDAPATFYYTIGDGVLMACLEAETDESVGWMAVGFSDNGMMVTTMSDVLNHTAAIGGWGPDVTKYALITKGGPQAPAALQTLTDASYVKADGMSTLMFTKPLVEEGEVPISEDGENIFIYAWGPSGGFHTTYGGITTGGEVEEEEEAEPATNDEVVPDVDEPATNDELVTDVDEPATLADSAAFAKNVLAAGTMAMGFAAALLL